MANSTTISTGFHAANENSLFGNLVYRIKNFFEYRAAVDELESLDDHLLSDIGITRTEIEYFAKGGQRLG